MNKFFNWRKNSSAPNIDVLGEFREFLKHRIDPNNGLLERLHKRRAISRDEVTKVLSETNYEARNIKLFNFISTRKTYNEFKKALRETDQSHVAIYLESNGNYKPELGGEWPLTEQHFFILNDNEKSLIDSLVTDHRLVNLLFSKRVINERKKKALTSKTTSEERNSVLLEILKRSSIRQYSAAIRCLHETNQSEIAKILETRLPQSRSSESNECIRRQLEDQEKRWTDALCRHRGLIADRMSPDFGLLDKLYSKGILTNLEMNIITEQKIIQSKNEKILRYVTSRMKSEKLIDALRESGQTHLVKYLEHDGIYNPDFGGDWPLTDKEIDILRSNYETLIDLLDIRDQLGCLYSANVINRRERDFISSEQTSYNQNKAFLEILRKCSLNSYWQTIRCLHASNQGHIAEIFERGGVVARVDSKLENVKGLNINETELEIVKQINNLLGNRTLPESSSIWQQVLELRLIGARQGHSVALYFHCQDMSDVDHLEELTEVGILEKMIETLFNQLLKVSLIKIWPMLKSHNFNQYRKIMKNIEAKKEFLKPKLESLMDLPLEILDIILEKAYFAKVIQRRIKHCENSEQEIMNYFSSVDIFWFQRMSKRRFKNSVWSHLSRFLKEWSSCKLSLQFIEENVRLGSEIASLKSMNCLSDVEIAILRRREFSKAKKRFSAYKSVEFSSMILNMCENGLDNFVKYLCSVGQNLIAKVLEDGGATVRVEIRSAKVSNRNHLIQQFVKRLNSLKTTAQQTPDEAENALRKLTDDGIEILNAVHDRDIVVWLWCKSANALERLKDMSESQSLVHIFRQLATKETAQLPQQTYVNMNYDRLKNLIVFFPSVKLVFTEKLQFRDKMANRAEVCGVTKLNDKIYVVCRNYSRISSLICAFECRRPFRRQGEIQLSDRVFPTDIASSERESCIYLIDSFLNDYKCLWKITALKQAKWLQFGKEFRPETLSVTRDDELLMVSRGPSSSLRVYDSHARHHLSIQLPSDRADIVVPRHALKTPSGDFVILHARWKTGKIPETKEEIGKKLEDYESMEYISWMVSLVSRNGKTMLRRYFEKENLDLLSVGGYLAMDSDGRVFVADTGNDRVILLDPDLHWNRILIPSKGEADESGGKKFLLPRPFRMFLDEGNQQLIVGGMDAETGVCVFAVHLV